MRVKVIAFGNDTESFIENRINDGVNVIYSDDNNRGKTLVMQGLMYSLGNEQIFPHGFKYKDQYFYSKIELNGELIEFLRKNSSFVIKSQGIIQLFNSVRDFRYFVDSNLFKLPRIIKDNKLKMVDLSLFYEMFFIGQDNRSPSNLISKGQFNKSDFKSMIFAIEDVLGSLNAGDEIDDLKSRIKSLKVKLKSIKKKISVIKSNPDIAEIASKSFDAEVTQKKMRSYRECYQRISEIKRSRQNEINRLSKLRVLISELNSLNRGLSEGNVKCGECGSEKIVYTNNDLTFEVSNTKVRSSIIDSIESNILQKSEIIDDLTEEINKEQDNLTKEMETAPPNFQEMVLYQDSILSEREIDNEALSVNNEIAALERELKLRESLKDDHKEAQKELMGRILNEMLKVYKIVDSNGNLLFDDLFTKKDATFSGSDEQEYYFSRVIALNNILEHEFPIIIDSFRDGELSTPKEMKMLKIYKKTNKQVILTSTLKKEEYEAQKYTSEEGVNALDYSNHVDCKIMQNKYSKEFMSIINSFEGIVI
ncbi:hypothetical protein [Pleionea sp. CnH1-48]|uniref:hypothetical protein n=1 Tax=Pleionea sp. CnH1-48 TaxID=2954494 RepID=UPI0020978157|nr:hypothetical protein [Pleionea sp. CnH1-48]MCO7222729.1 hypothetical protein [Pleionea sp. CnH1-48]